MKYILTVFIFLFICIGLSAQAPKKDPVMTKQDSVNAFVKKRDAAIDSIFSKTSMKDFQLWLDENVSSKSMREGKLNELWSLFINAKMDEWVKRNKIVIPN